MSQLLIVDGYNLIYQAERYRKWKDKDFEMARIKLIEDLATLKALKDYEIVLVFDAAKTASPARSHAEILGVEVIFTRTGETADQVIERMAFSSEFVGDIVVATSDYSQQKVIFRRGVLRKSARELIDELEATEKDLQEAAHTRTRFRLEDRLDSAVRSALERIIGMPE